MYDAAIIGTGPAGLSAAINLKQYNKNIIWFGSPKMSDKVEKSEKIANYPGLGMVTGPQLNEALLNHARELGLEMTDKMVTTVGKASDYYMLLAENDMYEARTVIFTTGVVTAKSIEGEAQMLGRGVSYCATCDGFLYKKKTIAVYCGAPRYEHEVEYLAELAEKVYLYTPYKEKNLHLPNIEYLNAGIKKILGENRVSDIILSNEKQVSVDGVFILRHAVAPAVLCPGLEMDGPHIVVNRQMETNYPGCYAAGDCTGIPYQLAKAVGEGNVAAHSVLKYLTKK